MTEAYELRELQLTCFLFPSEEKGKGKHADRVISTFVPQFRVQIRSQACVEFVSDFQSDSNSVINLAIAHYSTSLFKKKKKPLWLFSQYSSDHCPSKL